MKTLPIVVTLSFLPILWSCQKAENTEQPQKETTAVESIQSMPDQNFEVDAEALLKDYKTWYGYHYRTIHLAQDFTGLDTDSSQLTKAAFLAKLATGNYIALKTKLKDGMPTYALYRSSKADPDRQRTIKNLVSYELKNTSWEGKEMPEFSFTDLEGKVYNKVKTKGKTLVLKCWFIGCVACVKEFPELNELVDEYRHNPDVQFVSLASDTKPQLESFIKKKPFKYAVVPEQDNFMINKLDIKMYPTHLVVDGSGTILKVVNGADDLKIFLEKQSIN
ncbi:TlpA family protein disulfide reductase [Persicitalea sp.]|uniref:TlpA family protein disulfide reductase n=1 Tax=Persicitalea sp. TaxID=3100273 RepID=UPI003593E184